MFCFDLRLDMFDLRPVEEDVIDGITVARGYSIPDGSLSSDPDHPIPSVRRNRNDLKIPHPIHSPFHLRSAKIRG